MCRCGCCVVIELQSSQFAQILIRRINYIHGRKLILEKGRIIVPCLSVSDNELNNGDSITSLLGSATLLEEVSKAGDFLSWAEENQGVRELDEVLDGYRILARSALHVLGNSYLMESGPIKIEKDFQFLKSLRELGDIDKVQSDCDAAALSRKINHHNRQLALATTVDEFQKQLNRTTEELADPITDQYPENVRTTSGSLTLEQTVAWAAAEKCFTFLIDQRKNIPWGLFVSDFDMLISDRSELDDSIQGYTLGLEYLWKGFADQLKIDTSIFDELHQIEDWETIDHKYYGTLQVDFFDPLNEEYGIELGDKPLRTTEAFSNEDFSHLFADDRIPVIGKEEQLKQLLLWEHAERLDGNHLEKGALFISIVEGMVQVRRYLDTNEPVFVRRFVHYDSTVDGNNYSYAVRVDAPHLLGTNGMRGWATFVRVGTDYSGYGSSQYKRTEDRLDTLESKDVIEVEEMQLGEEKFKRLLKENHGSTLPEVDGEPEISREARYQGLTLDEILDGESKTVEWKQQFPGTDKTAEEIAALANTNGGVIVFGVGDDGSIHGVDDPEGLQLRVANLATSEKFQPPIYPDFEVVEVSEEELLLVMIEELDRPCAVEYRYYARVGTSVETQLFEELKQRFD